VSKSLALIKALFTHYRKPIHPEELAALACQIEIENLSVLRITVCYVTFTEGKLLNQVVTFLLNT
jgi:hypothetical protein